MWSRREETNLSESSLAGGLCEPERSEAERSEAVGPDPTQPNWKRRDQTGWLDLTMTGLKLPPSLATALPRSVKVKTTRQNMSETLSNISDDQESESDFRVKEGRFEVMKKFRILHVEILKVCLYCVNMKKKVIFRVVGTPGRSTRNMSY